MLKFRIALRYLLSRKQFAAVNIISAISVAAVAVAAAAMVIVLSVFNGFSQLAQSKLSALDPDYLLTPIRGKHVANVDSLSADLQQVEGVALACGQITEQAYACGSGAQMAVTLLGLTPEALNASGMNSILIDGSGTLSGDSTALLSVGVAMALGARPQPGLDEIAIYEPRRVGHINPANPMAAFRRGELRATGVYQVEQDEYDRDMIIVPYSMAASLLGYDNEATAIAIYSHPGAKPDLDHIGRIAESAGLDVADRFRQQEQTYRMIAIEKWLAFVMLGFILVIASANIISTLSMLILDKEPNMGILKAMGATRGVVQGIFTTQGWLIVAIGGVAGTIAGVLLVAGQMHFGWIGLGASNPELMSIQSYPVALKWTDVAFTLAAVAGVGLLLTPVVRMMVSPARN